MNEPSIDARLDEARAVLQASPAAALDMLREIAQLEPENPVGLALAGEALRQLGEPARAAQADAQVVVVLSRAPQLADAKKALDEHKIGVAERILKAYLEKHRNDPAALSMLAALAVKIGRFSDAERLLRRTLAILPSFSVARYDLSVILYRTGRYAEALKAIDAALETETSSGEFLDLKASVLGTLGRVDEAVAIYEDITVQFPDKTEYWIHFAHHLRAIGRREEAVSAYRRALALDPSFGSVWWSLANLKTVKFNRDDAAALTAQLARDDISAESRINMHFALGKALEDRGDIAGAFESYSSGNALQMESMDYRPYELEKLVERSEAIFSSEFFANRTGFGDPAPDPIFIVGMPRAGSTLVEQILSSHPEVEGTAELGYIPAIALELRNRPSGYPDCLATMDASETADLAKRYLALSRSHRRTNRPLFIDKNPNNWMHVGLIRLILPNAKIIDVRRNPIACGLSNFRQLFARGQGFSYSLEQMGAYYARYVGYMRHMDKVVPGQIHRLIYEDLVDDVETEVRRLLSYLGLEFSESCLRFHDNDRAVRTPSSLQVRQPLNRDGLDSWQPYDAWLGPLKEALGSALTKYRD